MHNAVFLVVTPHGSGNNRLFGETCNFHHQGEKMAKPGTTLAITSN
jgi:hypothetical protein